MTLEAVINLIDKFAKEFPIIVTKSDLGLTYLNNPIPMLTITNPNSTEPKQSLLFTGAHHARELSSISMGMYLLLQTMYNAYHNNTETWALLNATEIHFVPIVNLDGFKYIDEMYRANEGDLRYIRKNRNDGRNKGEPRACLNGADDQLGVDLNRNYDFMWGSSDQGSSPDVCGEDYRGAAPFSEPET
jgi:carboxypeptidase T